MDNEKGKLMKRIKALSIILVAVLLVSLGAMPACAADMVSIADIREETKDGWHQTYEAHGRSITIDVDIQVPDIQSVPILSVGFSPALKTTEPDSSYLQVAVEKTGIVLVKQSAADYFQGKGDSYQITGDDARAENNPLSAEEAQHIVESTIQQFYGQTGPLDIRLYSQMAKSRTYDRDENNGDVSDLNLDKPTSEMGSYVFQYDEYFHGIPRTRSGPHIYSHQGTEDIQFPGGPIVATIASANDYVINFNPTIEKGILIDDVPLISFAAVQRQFETFISAGLLRDVQMVRFAYYCFIDPKGTDSFVLQPVWQLMGMVTDGAGDPNPEPNSFTPEYTQKHWGQTLLIDAFTGEIIGEKANWDVANLSRY